MKFVDHINKIRIFFPKPKGEEGKIIKLIQSLFEKIDKKKHGTIIGRKRKIDYGQLMAEASFPDHISQEDAVIDRIVSLYEGVGLWGHPQTQINVLPPPTSISIAAAALAARYNENALWDNYAMSAAQSEVMAIGMLADLIGFNKSKAWGVFTFGGTGCNLYAARIGIEKASPDTKHKGMRDKIHIFTSDVSHYSIKSVAMWTGIGSNNIKVIPSDERNIINIKALENALKETIKSGSKIGTIFATMGTTDAFGIDPLKEIVEIRDKIQQNLDYKIHVHADAVIGWPYLTFKGDKNIKHLPHPLQDEIMSIVSKITEVQYADSVGIDFHKTGWAPYLCSAFIVKNKDDLFLLQRVKADMPYLYHENSYQPGVFTLETSRPNYAQQALVNMLLLGKEGFESLIIHLLTVADYFRAKIENSQEIALLNRYNPAVVSDFRIYPEIKFDHDGRSLFEKELNDEIDNSFTQRINKYNQNIAQRMTDRGEQNGTSLISYTDSYRTTKKKRRLVALKSYPMSPFTDQEDMDKLIADLYRNKESIDFDYNS